MNLNILISTIDGGIFKCKDIILPCRSDVSYIISHQYRDEKYKTIPNDLIRKDITISQIPGFGVTKSRNNAIRLADGDIALFSDDDVTYTNQYFDTIIEAFQSDSNIDIALFKIKTPDGFPEYKNYPASKIEVNKKLPFYIGTIEIAIKVDAIKRKGVLFDERFGAGQPELLGSDENIFVIDSIKKGLRVVYFPQYIVEHPYESTIKNISYFDKRRVKNVGAYEARIYGFFAYFIAIYATIVMFFKMIKKKVNPLKYLYQRFSAISYILRTNNQ